MNLLDSVSNRRMLQSYNRKLDDFLASIGYTRCPAEDLWSVYTEAVISALKPDERYSFIVSTNGPDFEPPAQNKDLLREVEGQGLLWNDYLLKARREFYEKKNAPLKELLNQLEVKYSVAMGSYCSFFGLALTSEQARAVRESDKVACFIAEHPRQYEL